MRKRADVAQMSRVGSARYKRLRTAGTVYAILAGVVLLGGAVLLTGSGRWTGAVWFAAVLAFALAAVSALYFGRARTIAVETAKLAEEIQRRRNLTSEPALETRRIIPRRAVPIDLGEFDQIEAHRLAREGWAPQTTTNQVTDEED